MTTPYAWTSVSAWVVQFARLTPAPAASWWILSASTRCPVRKSQASSKPWLNDLINRALIRAETPAVMEPHGLSRDDGKRPDDLTLVPWQSGRSATWDVTVAHTLATPYVSQNELQAGSPQRPSLRERRPSTIRSPLVTYFFSGGGRDPWSDEAHGIITEIGRRATLCTADPREATFLYTNVFQWQFSVSMQCALPTRFTVSEFRSQPFRTYIFAFANIKTLGMKYQGKKVIIMQTFVYRRKACDTRHVIVKMTTDNVGRQCRVVCHCPNVVTSSYSRIIAFDRWKEPP